MPNNPQTTLVEQLGTIKAALLVAKTKNWRDNRAAKIFNDALSALDIMEKNYDELAAYLEKDVAWLEHSRRMMEAGKLTLDDLVSAERYAREKLKKGQAMTTQTTTARCS